MIEVIIEAITAGIVDVVIMETAIVVAVIVTMTTS
jgi:hypothetical protein